ncbi:cohesin complex component [Aureococcus anophagefferens]|uniref:Cohesin complex component n=1 Tax=Aureococcus anophagefferens TaxID=44056 RepID=A0ABR1G6X8_AURAN
MFYSHSILAKSGPFAHVWLAATWEKKLTRSMIFNTDIATAVESIVNPPARRSLRLSANLLVGVVRIYARKARPRRPPRSPLRPRRAPGAPPPRPLSPARASAGRNRAEPQVAYLMNDCNEAMVKIRMAFRGGVVDLPEENAVASTAAITAARAGGKAPRSAFLERRS